LTGLLLIAGDDFVDEDEEGVGEDGLGEEAGWYAGIGSNGRGIAESSKL
jgi:hypothetical protein